MSRQFIVVSSITYAYKGRDALQNKGFSAYIERAPKELSSCGCHYCVYFKNCSVEYATEILKSAHVRIISTGVTQ
ncbi:MAG TPA: putative Se/S carrier-like protein [Clostridia bacterium]|nr:putative Se/S carrier-like protein [Clostridia bacterium]